MDKTYPKARGCAGAKGINFQVNLLSLFLLNAFRQRIKDWRLSTENKFAGKFDDVVLEYDGGAILLQAKHKDNRKITLDQLLSTNAKNEDFSLPKYFLSYLDVRTKFQVKFVVICTNTQAEDKVLKFLKQNSVDRESMLHHQDEACFFTFSDDIVPDLTTNARIYLKNNAKGKDVDKSMITEENVKEFLKHLQLYLNYPSEDDLEKATEKILSALKSFHNLLYNISYRDLHQKVKDWFEQPKGQYITECQAKAMFCEIKSDKYHESLDNYKVFFNSNDSKITTSEQRILHVVTERGHLLPLMWVYRILRESKLKTLYVDCNCSRDIQVQIIETFQLPTYTYLIIASSKFSDESVTRDICTSLRDILQSQSYKKVIFVTENNKLPQSVISSIGDYEIFNKSLTLEDLSEDSQNMLLQKRCITFQGEDASLEELFPEQITEDHKRSVNAEILDKLVRGDKIKVGIKVMDLEENVSRYYIHRKFERVTKKAWDDDIGTEEKKETVFEGDIYNVDEKLVLISDSAGTGKTTVLRNLAVRIKENNPHLWVVRIDLNDCTKILSDCLQHDRSVNAWELLNCQDPTKPMSELETVLFSSKGMMVLMFDGVDEISPDYTKLVLSVLARSQKAENVAKIFATTRPHMAQELERQLNASSFALVPLTEHNQIDFLTSYWAHNLKPDSDYYCREYAKKLITKVSSWMTAGWYVEKNNRFIAFPLQARMLAEVFLENKGSEEWEGCREYLKTDVAEPNLPERINIAKLYGMFIGKKRHVFLCKGNPSGNTMANQALKDQFEECLAYHRSLALKTILTQRECALFSSYQHIGENEVKVLKMGIVQKSDNRFCFVHRTFAEYFVAESLLKELQLQNPHVGFQRFLIDEVFFKSELNILRHFLDNFLESSTPPPSCATFERYKSLVGNTNNSNLIHRLAREGYSEIIRFLLRCVRFKSVESSGVYLTDYRLGSAKRNTLNILQCLVKGGGLNIMDDQDRTPLHRAVIGCHLDTVKLLVEMGADVNSNSKVGGTALHLAVERGRRDIIEFIFEAGVDVNVVDEQGRTALHLATKGRSKDIIESLVERGVLIDAVDEEGRSALHFAAKGGWIDIVQYLVKQDACISLADEYGRSALHFAAQKGSGDVVKFFLELGTDVNVVDNRGRTALHLAAKEGNLELVRNLLEYGGDFNMKDAKGRTALHLATKAGSWGIVQFLKEHGADINVKDGRGRTALHFATDRAMDVHHLEANATFPDVIDFLVEHGADINVADDEGNTALHSAVIGNSRGVLSVLLERGADVTAADNRGRNGLYFAAERNHMAIFQLLLERVDINSVDLEGRTVLHAAVLKDRWVLASVLLENGADVNTADGKGYTALHSAVERSSPEMVELLLINGADINVSNTDGHTPLHLIALAGRRDVIELFVDLDVRTNATDRRGNTALHLAARGGCWYIAKLLVEFDTDVDVRNEKGRTALHLAAQGGSRDIVKFLVELSAGIEVRDNAGRTALHLAAKRGRWSVVEFLAEYGANIDVMDRGGLKPIDLAVLRRHSRVSEFLSLLGSDTSSKFEGVTEGWSSSEEELEFD